MNKTVMLHAQQKWEYMELTRKTESYLLSEINDCGQQGWELVSVTHGKDLKGELSWTAFLKRPFVGHAPHANNNHQVEHPQAMGDRVTVQPSAAAAADDGGELRFKDE